MTSGFPSVMGPEGPQSEPVFAEPWQAQAFAMAVHLHARGLYTWPEWAQALAQQIAAEPADLSQDDPAATYYRHWLAALEQMVASKCVASTAELTRCAVAWDHAADRTPHGQPIVLQADDFSRSANR